MRSRTWTAAIAVSGGGLIVICALGSPLALAAADRWWRLNWRHLADIGQAYGAASAVFSALAVAGVAASLVYQGRQLRLARLQAVRNAHRELLIRVMDHPSALGPAVGFHSYEDASIEIERFLFLTAYANYLRSGFEVGEISERNLRTEVLPDLFSGEIGRRWWARVSADWRTESSPARVRFTKIAEEEYQKAVAAGPGRRSPIPAGRPLQSNTPRGLRPAGWLTAAIAFAALAGWMAGRRHRR